APGAACLGFACEPRLERIFRMAKAWKCLHPPLLARSALRRVDLLQIARCAGSGGGGVRRRWRHGRREAANVVAGRVSITPDQKVVRARRLAEAARAYRSRSCRPCGCTRAESRAVQQHCGDPAMYRSTVRL